MPKMTDMVPHGLLRYGFPAECPIGREDEIYGRCGKSCRDCEWIGCTTHSHWLCAHPDYQAGVKRCKKCGTALHPHQYDGPYATDFCRGDECYLDRAYQIDFDLQPDRRVYQLRMF